MLSLEAEDEKTEAVESPEAEMADEDIASTVELDRGLLRLGSRGGNFCGKENNALMLHVFHGFTLSRSVSNSCFFFIITC